MYPHQLKHHTTVYLYTYVCRKYLASLFLLIIKFKWSKIRLEHQISIQNSTKKKKKKKKKKTPVWIWTAKWLVQSYIRTYIQINTKVQIYRKTIQQVNINPVQMLLSKLLMINERAENNNMKSGVHTYIQVIQIYQLVVSWEDIVKWLLM